MRSCSIVRFARNCLLAFLLLFVSEAFGQTIIPDSLLYREWDEISYEQQNHSWTKGCDSIDYYIPEKTFYYNIDSLCRLIATHPFSEIAEKVWYFYYLVDIYGPQRRETDRVKILNAIERYKCKALEQELDVYDVYKEMVIPITQEKWDWGWKMIQKYEKKGELQTKLRIMQRIFYGCSGVPAQLVSGSIQKDRLPVMKLIKEILSTLERLEGEPFLFEPGYFYTNIGLIYYNFKYYDKAVPLLQKAVKQPQGHYFNRNVMIARDYLGDYYTRTGDYDRSDSLYFSILASPDLLRMRAVYDVVAIGAIAGNALQRGNKDEAIRLYTLAMTRAMEAKDSTLAGGYALHLGRLHMENGELDKTRRLIDSARVCLIAGNLPIRNWERFYTLSRDYQLKLNQSGTASLYIDSIAFIRAEEDSVYNARLLAYSEQEAYEVERQLKEQQLKKANTRTIWVTVILASSLLLLFIICCSHRKLQQKNGELFLRIKAQDAESARHEELLLNDTAAPVSKEAPGNTRQQILFVRLREYLLKDKNFAKTDIDINMLIAELSTNRTYLFDAIKTYTGKTLQEYMNQLRLEEAKRLLETTDQVIESIALSCGYNSARTFYRLFKANYNMSPATYRKMAKNPN